MVCLRVQILSERLETRIIGYSKTGEPYRYPLLKNDGPGRQSTTAKRALDYHNSSKRC
ncbi:hypothetical protein HAX54_015891, partial [Datura stramonium]|nr:hypothetical protein [Datura stramonium]